MPVAAIEALVLLLSQLPPTLSTISETLDVVATSTALLKRSIPNPISLVAGTDLFQRYLITTLQRAGGDFKSIRQHLVSNGRLFVKRAKEARQRIAGIAKMFVREGSVVLTNGGSRVVGAVLQAAAEGNDGGSPRFKVIYVQSWGSPESEKIIRSLRQLHVPVAVIPESAVAYSMGKVSMVMVGAEGVVENGGIISRMGTYQMGILAKAAGKPLYVVAESHKFVRMFPLGQYDLPIEQQVVVFRTDGDPKDLLEKNGERSLVSRETSDSTEDGWVEKTPYIRDHTEYFDKVESPKQRRKSRDASIDLGSSKQAQDPLKPPDVTAKTPEETLKPTDGAVQPLNEQYSAVDYTPPDLITAVITESGVHTPSAVSEELIKLWY
jgi:translation initiation factor eIF-2B subunit alpha